LNERRKETRKEKEENVELANCEIELVVGTGQRKNHRKGGRGLPKGEGQTVEGVGVKNAPKLTKKKRKGEGSPLERKKRKKSPARYRTQEVLRVNLRSWFTSRISEGEFGRQVWAGGGEQTQKNGGGKITIKRRKKDRPRRKKWGTVPLVIKEAVRGRLKGSRGLVG